MIYQSFRVQSYIIAFLLARHYPDLFIKLKPQATPGTHDNPQQLLLDANTILKEQSLEIEAHNGKWG